MYNFRYHLVSIVSVFVALALGLLLGAAIAGSDLARNTSDSMVDSMLARFDDLSSQNTQLEQLAGDNGSLADQYITKWAKNRLDGRTIAVVLGTSDSDKTLTQDLNSNLTRGNAAVVSVTVSQPQFGLDNLAVRQTLQKILPAVQGEDYQITLANRLAEEWSYSYLVSESDAPTAEDIQIQDAAYPVVSATTIQGQTDSLSGPSAQSINIQDGIEPQTAFQKTIYSQYTLTRALLTLGIISVDTNYRSLLEHKNPAIPESQAAALAVAKAWHLPYAVNGLIDGLTTTTSSNLISSNSTGLALASEFAELGTNNKLKYPVWLAGALPNTVTASETLPNYYVLLVQSSPSLTIVSQDAGSNGFSCVTSPTSTYGRYSVLALLSGAQAGIYGEDRPQDSRFPTLPSNTTGRAPLA